MPKQNRVTPFGDLIATPERGTLYGNRGCLVGRNGEIRRRFNGARWLICLLSFKGRRHPMMAPGRYTGLFFLDEATALAAGHRPCAECQRERFELFRRHWTDVNPAFAGKPSAPFIDAVLHAERLGDRPVQNSIEGLPNGTFVSDNGVDPYLTIDGDLLRWTPGGYERTKKVMPLFRILTPVSVVKVLKAGYPVGIHQSAGKV